MHYASNLSIQPVISDQVTLIRQNDKRHPFKTHTDWNNMTLIQTILAFIVVIGLLVAVHEFGHYWVARRLGVKILRFSIGFGQPLFKRQFGKDQTEFVIAAIPLGGYVKMLDENEQEVPAEERHRAFNRQSLATRSAIVFAGPLFNLLFAIIAYTAMYMIGVTGMTALVGKVSEQSLAEQAGFKTGHQIVAINEQSANTWERVVQITLTEMLNNEQQLYFTVQTPSNHEYDITLSLTQFTIDDLAEGQFFDKIGLHPYRPPWPALIGEIMPNSAAEKAGLQTGDQIIALDNQPIETWKAWATYISDRPGQPIQAQIIRRQQQLELTIIPDEVSGNGRMGVYAPYFTTEHYPIWPAFKLGLEKMWEMTVLTLRVMVKMLTLQISYQHLSGPITIAEVAGQTAQLGPSFFLSFLGLVSLSLGIINLLPIPLLDGGHLLFYLIEWIKGSPISQTLESLFQRVGIALLLCLMGIAIMNDLVRLFN
jgi:regulator of sigma E protease